MAGQWTAPVRRNNNIARSSSGRTTDSDSVYVGSNPTLATINCYKGGTPLI